MQYDYTKLKLFIKTQEKLRNPSGLANFLGVTRQNISLKLTNKSCFTQDQIMRLKEEFKMSPRQVGILFFSPVRTVKRWF